MNFHIKNDFFDNDKILVFCGTSGVGKTQLLINFANNLNYSVNYIDIDNCVKRSDFENKNISIIRLYEFDDIYNFLLNIRKTNIIDNNLLIIIDQINNFRKTTFAGEKSKRVKELIYLMYKIQKEQKIKFIISCNMYTDISSMCTKVPDYLKNKLTNIIIIKSYRDVKNFNIKQQLRIMKLKNILC